MEQKKLSLTYRMLRRMRFNYPEEEYGQVSLWQVFKRVCKTYRDSFLLIHVMNSWLLSPFSTWKVRPWVLRYLRYIKSNIGRKRALGKLQNLLSTELFVNLAQADHIFLSLWCMSFQ